MIRAPAVRRAHPYARGCTAGLVLLTLACALAAPRPAAAQAQADAWVPGKGHGTFTTAYGDMAVQYHLDYQGNRFDAGRIDSRILFLSLDYGITDRLALTTAIPYIQKRYRGSAGHNPDILEGHDDDHEGEHHHLDKLDNGDYHGAWQDFGFKLRYNAIPGPVAVTPFVAANMPSHDYLFFAHSAVGTHQKRLTLGVDFGYRFEPPLQNLYAQAGYGYSFVEENYDVNVDHSILNLELGYAFTPKLLVKLQGNGQKTHGGLEFPIDFTRVVNGVTVPDRTSEKWFHHDQILRVDYWNMGVVVNYIVADGWTLLGAYGKTLWGENGHEIQHAVTAGVSYTF